MLQALETSLLLGARASEQERGKPGQLQAELQPHRQRWQQQHAAVAVNGTVNYVAAMLGANHTP